MLLARGTRLLADCGIHIGFRCPPRQALAVSLESHGDDEALGRRQEMVLMQRGSRPVAGLALRLQ